MEDKFLFTNLCPLLEEGEQESLNDCFRRELSKSDRLEIAVGFCSNKSLKELEKLIFQMNIKKVCVILGMYYFDVIPKSMHKFALEVHEKWGKLGIGEIRLVNAWKYHVKLYCFFRKNKIFSAIFGSPNLSFLTKKSASVNSQREIALLINNPKILRKFPKYLEYLKSKDISENILALEEYKLDTNAEEDDETKKKQNIFKITYKKFFR